MQPYHVMSDAAVRCELVPAKITPGYVWLVSHNDPGCVGGYRRELFMTEEAAIMVARRRHGAGVHLDRKDVLARPTVARPHSHAEPGHG